MNWDKIMAGIEEILQNISEEDLKRILKEVKSMNIEGKTFEEYLKDFESEYNISTLKKSDDGVFIDIEKLWSSKIKK